MKATTLFSAYRKCLDEMSTARSCRGNLPGIAVDSDPWAKHYQKRQRLANLLETKLEKILGDVDLQNRTRDRDHGSDRTIKNPE